MLSNDNGTVRLPIVIATVVTVSLPSLLANPALSLTSAISHTPEQVCRAPQQAFLTFDDTGNDTYVIDSGNADWQASPGVNTDIDTESYVEGASSTRFTVQEGFRTGPIAGVSITNTAKPLNSHDTGYISFWIRSSKKLDDSVLQLSLFDDTSGKSLMNIDIPGEILDGQNWRKFNVSFSRHFIAGNDVDSMVLYAISDPGNVTIWLDMIEAGSSSALRKYPKFSLNELVLNHDKGLMIAG